MMRAGGSVAGAEGASARILASDRVAQIVGPGVYDFMREPDKSKRETRFGNMAGTMLAFSVLDAGNQWLTKSVPLRGVVTKEALQTVEGASNAALKVGQRAGLQAGVGLVAGAVGYTGEHLNSSFNVNDLGTNELSTAAMNVIFPLAGHGVSKITGAAAEKLGWSQPLSQFVNNHPESNTLKKVAQDALAVDPFLRVSFDPLSDSSSVNRSDHTITVGTNGNVSKVEKIAHEGTHVVQTPLWQETLDAPTQKLVDSNRYLRDARQFLEDARQYQAQGDLEGMRKNYVLARNYLETHAMQSECLTAHELGDDDRARSLADASWERPYAYWSGDLEQHGLKAPNIEFSRDTTLKNLTGADAEKLGLGQPLSQFAKDHPESQNLQKIAEGALAIDPLMSVKFDPASYTSFVNRSDHTMTIGTRGNTPKIAKVTHEAAHVVQTPLWAETLDAQSRQLIDNNVYLRGARQSLEKARKCQAEGDSDGLRKSYLAARWDFEGHAMDAEWHTANEVGDRAHANRVNNTYWEKPTDDWSRDLEGHGLNAPNIEFSRDGRGSRMQDDLSSDTAER
jgi:hypothetical protein